MKHKPQAIDTTLVVFVLLILFIYLLFILLLTLNIMSALWCRFSFTARQ